MTLESFPAALEWLRDVAGELAEVPTVLHVHEVQPSDLLGAPRMSGGFYSHLTDSPFATRPAAREVTCPEPHPIGAAPCETCGGALTWTTTTDVYVRPLAAALSALSRARSRLRPHPYHVIRALLREGLDPRAAALRLDPAPDERRYLSALRALYDLFSYTAIAPPRRRAA